MSIIGAIALFLARLMERPTQVFISLTILDDHLPNVRPPHGLPAGVAHEVPPCAKLPESRGQRHPHR
jgi:hypothetical protein